MRADGFAAVILDLFVGLKCFLWRQEIGAGAERIGAGGEAERTGSDSHTHIAAWIEDIGAADRVGDAVSEFHVTGANAVSEGPGGEVNATNMHRRVVQICKRIEGVGNKTLHVFIL